MLLGKSPLIDSWPLMGSPAPLILLFGSYLLFVLNIGPRYMQNRKPFKLTKFIRAYNVFQVIACVYFVEWSINRNVTYKSTWTCIPNKNEPAALMDYCKHTWYFLILRIIEFSETVVFVLRKKQNQVSTLHIYHHISTVVLLWLFLKFSPSEIGVYISGINSSVHVVMYSYYYFSSYKKWRSRLQIVKPLITIIQLVQLVLITGQSVVALFPSCKETSLFYGQVANGLILIGFFIKFYVQSYFKKKSV